MHTLVVADALVLGQMASSEARGTAGLTPRAFGQFTRALTRTAWGREHVRPVALVDESSRLLASALVYRLSALVDARPTTICAVGDVIAYATPGDGSAPEASLIAAVVPQVDRLCPGAGLVATVARAGAAVPEGFRVLPTLESTLRVTESTRRGAPMAPVRSGHRDDLPFLVDVPRLGAATPRVVLERSVDFMDFGLIRQRLLAGLGVSGARELWFLVVEEGMRAAAYVVITVAGDQWVIEACGDRDPTGARIGAILQTLIAREPSERRPTITAWLPTGFVPPQVTITATRLSDDRLCVRPLTGGPSVDDITAAEVSYWHGDLM